MTPECSKGPESMVLSALLRGMARRASFQRRLANRWHSRAELELRGRVSDTAKAMTERGQLRAEVSRLREQLAAQPHVPVDASDHVFAALERVAGVHTGGQLGDQTDAVMDLLKSWGVSSSEVGAPQPQEMEQHKVIVEPYRETMWDAYCVTLGCGQHRSGSLTQAQDWKDQHEADTLRPTPTYDVLDEEPFGSADDCTDPHEDPACTEADCPKHSVEGRPSGSERRAPRPVETFDCKQDCPAVAPECWCVGTEPHRLCCHEDAAQAARSEATPEAPSSPPSGGDSDTTPRVWTVGDPEPDESVQTVRAANSQVFRRIWLRSVRHPLWQAGIGGQVTWAVMLGAVGPVTEVLPSPSLHKKGEDTPSLTDRVLADVAAERDRQESKWGQQNHADRMPADYPIGDRPNADLAAAHWKNTNSERVAWMNDHGMPKDRNAAWDGILLEEVYEALAETDSPLLRMELIQVAAVAVAWVEAIDRRVSAAVSSQEEKKEGETDGR